MNAYSPFEHSFFDGADLVAVMEVFADASEMDDYLTIGAILFRKKHIKPFEKKWRKMLKKYDLSHFHMTDCNAKEKEFKGKTEADCDACARRAIELVLEYAAYGTIFSVKKSDFYEIITEKGIVPNPFTLGAYAILFDIMHWADLNDPKARIAYVFEAGDNHQSDANRLLDGIAKDDERRARFRYRMHAFVPKRESLPTQAADLLAWQGAKHIRRKNNGLSRLRGDFDAVVTGLQVANLSYDRDKLKKLVSIAKHHAGKQGNEFAGLANRHHSLTAKELRREFVKILQEDGDRPS